MILLDTNVLSEFMRAQPSAQVVAWLDEQPAETVWVSAISRAEIELGLALMPKGKRQMALAWRKPLRRCSTRTLPVAACRLMKPPLSTTRAS